MTDETTTALTVDRSYQNTEHRRPVLHTYPMQYQPQDAFVELTESGNVAVRWNPEIGSAIPVSVWNNCDYRWKIAHDLTTDEIDDLLDEALPLLERVHDGLTVAWDGSNRKGHLDGDADDANYRLDRMCSERMTETDWDEDYDGDMGEFWASC